MEGQTTTIQDCFLMAQRIEKVEASSRTNLMDMVLVMYHHIKSITPKEENHE